MTVGTTRLHQQNVELFAKLNDELKSLQEQVGTGKAELKLSENLYDISKLSAAEEKKSETQGFLENSQRVVRDLEHVDQALDQAQNLIIRLQEIAVETANDVLGKEERERYIYEAEMIKTEILDMANQRDSFGNNLFGGTSGGEKPFKINALGEVSYHGSAIRKTVQVSEGLKADQNFSGHEVFMGIGSGSDTKSIFSLVDDLVSSLKVSLTSNSSSKLFSDGGSVDLVFPSTQAEAKVQFDLVKDGVVHKISATVYGNDYSVIASAINQVSGSTGVSANVVSGNRIRLQGTAGSDVIINSANFSNYEDKKTNIGIIKDVSSSNIVEKISENRLSNQVLTNKIGEAFQHFSNIRNEVSASARRAQQSEIAAQELLILLEDDMSDIRDADLANLLTKIEFLMTNREAAQATFTRITSKSLFDYLG